MRAYRDSSLGNYRVLAMDDKDFVVDNIDAYGTMGTLQYLHWL